MAAKKPKKPRRGAPRNGARAYAVALERMEGHLRVYGEALTGFREKFEAEFRELRSHVDEQFGRVNSELRDLRADVTELKVDVSQLKVDVGLLKTAATVHTQELREIRAELAAKVDRADVEAIVQRAVQGR